MNQQCEDYCLYVENELGAYFESSDSCYCGHLISKEHLNERQLRLPSKIKQKKSSSVIVPYINAENDISLPWEND